MVQRYSVKLAVMKDVPTKLSKEEYVGDMVQRYYVKLAGMKDVPTKQSREDSDRHGFKHYHCSREGPIKQGREEYVGDMGRNTSHLITTQTT